MKQTLIATFISQISGPCLNFSEDDQINFFYLHIDVVLASIIHSLEYYSFVHSTES